MGRIKKTVLITGGSGFIGRNLIEVFSTKYNILSPTHKELNLLNTVAVSDFFNKNKIDIVLHGALVGGSRKEEYENNSLKKNLLMFFNIVKNSNKFNKMINFGSGAEYDKSKPIVDVKEENFGDKIPVDDYGFLKYICSKVIEEQNNIVNLRIFGLFGKYEDYRYRFISNAICQNLAGLPIIINQNVYFTYVYIDDFIKIIDYFIKNETKDRVFNIRTGQKIDLLTITKYINDIAEKKSKIIVKNNGLNNEYTCNNDRLMGELNDFKFENTMKENIKVLYNWYKKSK
jgi:UDP-glucose 4-epimerase